MTLASESRSPVAGRSAAPAPPDTRWRDLARAFALANLCFSNPWVTLFLTLGNQYYMAAPPAPVDLAAMLFNITVLAGLLWVAARGYRRRESPLLTRVAAVVLVGLLLFGLGQLLRAAPIPLSSGALPPVLRRVFKGVLFLALCAAAGAGCNLLYRQPRRLLRAAANVSLVLFPFFPLVFAQAAWTAFRSPLPVGAITPRPPVAGSTQRTHTVVLLFDELDYGIAFERRPADLSLPELDRLAAEAWTATQAFPPAGATLTSVPGLLCGRRVSDATERGYAELRLTFRGEPGTASWGDLATFFTDARERGERTGVTGWYHPYGRLFGKDLDACTSETFYYWHSQPQPRFLEAVAHQVELSQLLGPAAAPAAFGAHHLRTYRRLVDASARMAADPSLDLVYLHLSIPHLPGILDRHSGRLSVRRPWDLEAYLGNLALADRALGQVRGALEAAGLWERTTLVVTSDHWLREKGLNPAAEYRVPYLVKLPGQRSHQEFTSRFNTVLTRDLLREHAAGRLRDPAALTRWVTTRSQKPDQR